MFLSNRNIFFIVNKPPYVKYACNLEIEKDIGSSGTNIFSITW